MASSKTENFIEDNNNLEGQKVNPSSLTSSSPSLLLSSSMTKQYSDLSSDHIANEKKIKIEKKNKSNKKYKKTVDVIDFSRHFFHERNVLYVFTANCIARKALYSTLMWLMNTVFPYSNTYGNRREGLHSNLSIKEDRPLQGTIEICTPDANSSRKCPSFAYLFCNYRMGGINSEYYVKSRHIDADYLHLSKTEDTKLHRLNHFNNCLKLLLKTLANKKFEYIEHIIFINSIYDEMSEDYKNGILNFANEINLKVSISKSDWINPNILNSFKK